MKTKCMAIVYEVKLLGFREVNDERVVRYIIF